MSKNETQSPANKETLQEKPLKKLSLRKTVRSILITILSILCILGGVLIHKLHSTGGKTYPSFRRANIVRTSDITGNTILTVPHSDSGLSKQSTPLSFPQNTKASVLKENLSEATTTEKSQALANDIRNEFEALQKNQSDFENKPDEPVKLSSDLKEKKTLSITQEEEKQHLPPEKQQKIPLLAILNLQHDFYHTASCKEAFETLSHKNDHDTKVQQLIVDLSPFCTEAESAKKRLKTLFLKDKKQAFYTYYQSIHAPWYAYLRAFLSDLIDIHKINPTEQTPQDIIDRAQTVLSDGNISEAVRILSNLPFELKIEFASFLREASAYIRAEESFRTLILSYDIKGK